MNQKKITEIPKNLETANFVKKKEGAFARMSASIKEEIVECTTQDGRNVYLRVPVEFWKRVQISPGTNEISFQTLLEQYCAFDEPKGLRQVSITETFVLCVDRPETKALLSAFANKYGLEIKDEGLCKKFDFNDKNRPPTRKFSLSGKMSVDTFKNFHYEWETDVMEIIYDGTGLNWSLEDPVEGINHIHC